MIMEGFYYFCKIVVTDREMAKGQQSEPPGAGCEALKASDEISEIAGTERRNPLRFRKIKES